MRFPNREHSTSVEDFLEKLEKYSAETKVFAERINSLLKEESSPPDWFRQGRKHIFHVAVRKESVNNFTKKVVNENLASILQEEDLVPLRGAIFLEEEEVIIFAIGAQKGSVEVR